MNNLKPLFVLTAGLCIAACQTETPVQDDARVPLRLSGDITANLISRATETAWESNDAIGVYMVSQEDGSVQEEVANYKYTTGGDGVFTAAEKVACLPIDGRLVNVVAYYPYAAEASDGVVSVNMAEAPCDLMTAKVESVSKASPDAGLKFAHRFAKLTLRVDAGTTGIDPSSVSAVVSDQPTSASFSVLQDALAIGSGRGDVKMTNTAGVLEAILFPNSATDNPAAERTVKFSLADGGSFSAKIPASVSFAAGTKYTFKVKLSSADGPAAQFSKVGISQWADVLGEDIDVEISRKAAATFNLSGAQHRMSADEAGKVFSWTGEIAKDSKFSISVTSSDGESLQYHPESDGTPLNDYEAPQTVAGESSAKASDKNWTVGVTGVYTVSLNAETKTVGIELHVVAQAYNDQTWGEQQTITLAKTATPGIYQADMTLEGNKQFRLLAGLTKTNDNWDRGYQNIGNQWPGFGTNESDTFNLEYSSSSLGNFWTDKYPGKYTLVLTSSAEGLSLTVSKK